MIQLHGHEDDAYIQALHQKLGLPVVKAFSIEREEDVERANRSAAHYVLVDHGPGGTGKAFDWSCLRKMKRPYFWLAVLRQTMSDKHWPFIPLPSM